MKQVKDDTSNRVHSVHAGPHGFGVHVPGRDSFPPVELRLVKTCTGVL